MAETNQFRHIQKVTTHLNIYHDNWFEVANDITKTRY